ncbi:MAG: cytochrome b/b6 domain-containing protein [Candidatus Latescibacteria bacterium]|nr:cytochrome b/b6 domain-containing protein [Candidatus Latescibacterota bacterium]
MAEEERKDQGQTQNEAEARLQLERLLDALVGQSLPQGGRQELVRQVLEERRPGMAADLEALASRLREEVAQEVERRAQGESAPPRQYLRFSLNFRIQHAVLFSSCIALILTGLPIKFHDTGWAASMFSLMGGIQTSALIHRIGAVGLIGVGLYHLLYTGVLAEGRRNFLALIPGPKDLRDCWLMIRFFLGRTEERPRFGRFSYVEKFDYWAVYWGMIIMCGSGLMLWFENQTMRLFPKYIFDIAKEAHSDEALLATLAIIIWHFYNVHFNPHKFPMNKAWLTGRLSEEEMRHEHPLELEEIQGRGQAEEER